MRGLSGGERKRTAIAVELITNPNMIFLDEPTSGLDSFTAFRIVKILNRLSEQGKTVLATIHQPSSDIFSLFDRLVFLSDGYCIYQGPANVSTLHFKKFGVECPRFANPSDFFMKTFSLIANRKSDDPEDIKAV